MVDKIPVSEAQIKKAVEDRLQVAQNQGLLMFIRLNAGSFIISNSDGSFRRRIKGAPPGTADFVVFQGKLQELPICEVTFLELKKVGGKTSEAQDEFAEKATKQNARYFVVRDADEVKDILGLE